MTLLQKINLFFSVYLEALKSLKKPLLWVPFILFALAQFLLLLALVNFYAPFISFVFIPIIKKIMGEFVLHYPVYFLFLPKIFSRANLLLSGILGIIALGWATYLFFSYFLPDKRVELKEGLKTAFSRYLLLLVIWIIETVVILAWFLFLSRAGRGFVGGSFKKELAFEIFGLCSGVVFYGLFAFTIPAIILGGRNIFTALGLSISIYIRNFFSTYFFVLLPNLLTLPFTFLNRNTAFLISKFNPEVIILMLILEIAISMIANYILISTLTRFYLYDQGLD
jgi:hypothetical protein